MSQILKVDADHSVEDIITCAAAIVSRGGVIAYPTETFYGLGADATNEKSIRKIYALKGRNFNSPISVIISEENDLYPLVQEVPEIAQKLILSFWPGPLTIIFNASAKVLPLLTAGTCKIGVRISSHTGATAITQKLGQPLTATSANLSGAPECSTAGEVANQIGDKVDAIVDLGKTPGGKGSTIIDITVNPAKILREGTINRLFIGKCID